jgi:hypothetical protein
LLANTIKITTLLAAGEATAASAISVQVSTLAEEVLKTMALVKQKGAGLVLLMAALVLSGGMLTYHLLASQPSEPGDRQSLPDTSVVVSPDGNGAGKPDLEADIKKYGSESDARNHAVTVERSRLRRRPGLPEIVQWSLQFWSEPAAKRSTEKMPRSQIWEANGPGEGIARVASLEAKLDRGKRQWTIIGVTQFGGPNAAWEVDWKHVFSYTPSTGWEGVDSGYFAANGEKIRSVGSVIDLLGDPVRYGLRPVGKKDGKGGER